MAITCAAPGCRSGYNSMRGKMKIHFFRPPKDPLRRATWQEKLQRKNFLLKNFHRVCHLHFSEMDIIKDDKFVINGERVILPRIRWALKVGATPEISLDYTKCLSKQAVAEKATCTLPHSSILLLDGFSESSVPHVEDTENGIECDLKHENMLLKSTNTKFEQKTGKDREINYRSEKPTKYAELTKSIFETKGNLPKRTMMKHNCVKSVLYL
ncbi:hypothetical protein ILUMI_24996 [Ignelater luminosus]|uniref:THAP-type domain-containing protein n=1 Tax=Ignelater luminosus TaxID=2038154 RepID=A0A8K0C9F1_IGNLU|nr:hypothetical protein ILUMI_24996 [Ignelater luminosus]